MVALVKPSGMPVYMKVRLTLGEKKVGEDSKGLRGPNMTRMHYKHV